MEGGPPGTPSRGSSSRNAGNKYAVKATGSGNQKVAESIVRNAVTRDLDLRPDLMLNSAPKDQSAVAKQYRDRAARALQVSNVLP